MAGKSGLPQRKVPLRNPFLRGNLDGKRGPIPRSAKGQLTELERAIETAEGLGQIQATLAEVAAVLRIAPQTLHALRHDHPELDEAYERGLAHGRVSLRRQQWKMAHTNPTMAIWLGKQWLGQKDRHEVGGDPDRPLLVQIPIVFVEPGQVIEGETIAQSALEAKK